MAALCPPPPPPPPFQPFQPPHNLPAARIVFSINTHQTKPCTMCGNPVRGDFTPIYCKHHRNNVEPTVGWAFVLRSEVRLINILRQHNWTSEALIELQQTQQQVQLAQLTQQANRMAIDPPDPGAPTSDRFIEYGDGDSDHESNDSDL